MNQRLWVWILVLALAVSLVGIGLLFTVETGSTEPEPVEFDDTVTVGLTLESQFALLDRPEVSLPRVQTFYSQYEYVVGYYGVDTYLANQGQPGHQQRFGYTRASYVTDYADTSVELSTEGYPIVERDPDWIPAESAWYVVGSEARSPAGETIPSFGDRESAAAFAERYGGTVESWEALTDRSFERDDADDVRERVDGQVADAEAVVAGASAHGDRPASVVVGEDVPTVQEGIDAAPANTTVVVTDGTYEETVEIDRPITLAGEGEATIRGNENGSVVTVTHPDVGVRNLTVAGSGLNATQADTLPGPEGDHPDDGFQVNYGGADAGISAHVADGVSIVDVSIDLRANGIALRESPGAVVRNVTVEAAADADRPYAGLMALRSPGVAENVTVIGGRDPVFMYRSDGFVLRDSEVHGGVLGVHLMHTNDALIADTVLRDVSNTGIYVMTGPVGNAIVGNDVSGSDVGITIGGSESYVAENVLQHNNVGLRIEADASLYERNLLAGNGVGAHAAAVLPTNRVIENDFVANDRHATAGHGPLRIWSHDGVGNYWQGATTLADGDPPARAYSPTDPVGARMHTTDGIETLARAPAVDALAGLEASISGMQTASIADLTPTCEPNNPALLASTDWTDDAYACDGTTVSEP
ncbi:NosD domain-containing protein [Halovivax gelatinilyticus]|uniref:NosD domain-containing protein n=1 Tax=Halovivax gelatinilyticus TaxID=2961597 RepID=UPI0020CA375E|nr:NosD domain-containing protein [Halovivax gelatinilyticus]